MEQQAGIAKFGEQQFTEEERGTIRRLLEQKLGKEHISYRDGPGQGKLAYLETNKAIQLANDIFGHTGWASSVVNLSVDYLEEVKASKFSAGVSAIVRISLKDGTHHEDIGYGTADNRSSKAQALDLAKKSAVSDGLKRALRLFGNALGNSLYDKEHLKKVKTATPSTNKGLPAPVKQEQQLVSKQPSSITSQVISPPNIIPFSINGPPPNQNFDPIDSYFDYI